MKDKTTTTRGERKRGWAFTLNNWSEEEKNNIMSQCHIKKWKYIFEEEVGKNGTPHLQGYIAYDNAIDFNVLQKMMPRANIMKAYKPEINNLKYCMKDKLKLGAKMYTNYPDDELPEAKDNRTPREKILAELQDKKHKEIEKEIEEIKLEESIADLYYKNRKKLEEEKYRDMFEW